MQDNVYAKNILITGANGLLGTEFCNNQHLANMICYTHRDLDICNKDAIETAVRQNKPDVIINCAAYNNLPNAEKEYKRAYDVNALGTQYLSDVCIRHQIKLVHISTDMVFDPASATPICTDDEYSPANAYGRSKVAGEKIILNAKGLDYLIIRVSWMFGQNGQNFVSKIVDLLRTKQALKIVADQYACVTYAPLVVMATLKLIEMEQTGIFQIANAGILSRYQFAKYIKKQLCKNENIDCLISPICAADYFDGVHRASYSVLSCLKYTDLAKTMIPTWQDAVDEYLKMKLRN